MTRCGWTISSRGRTGLPAIRSAARVTACRVIAAASWATVVRSTWASRASRLSSYPMTLRLPGTVRPARRTTSTSPVAHRSLTTQTALGASASSARPVLLGEPARHDAGRAVEAVPAHRLVVAAPALGRPRGPAAVDLRDVAVAQADQMIDCLVYALGLGVADHVDGVLPDAAGQHDHGQPAGDAGR